MMRMMEGGGTDSLASSSSQRLGRLFEKCPYTPGSVPIAGNALLWRPTEVLTSSVLQSGGAVAFKGRCDR
ncbi:MAG TPA: hypothetical protein VFS41_06805, partial [Edaphobacter sp.]|nr:hypothetical protein [Edaphobacter sp.]